MIFCRENEALRQLEQAKSDMVKLNNQLLEAVQQKLELSEQLEMWQVTIVLFDIILDFISERRSLSFGKSLLNEFKKEKKPHAIK